MKLETEYHNTGEINHDIVDEWFTQVLTSIEDRNHCLAEVKDYKNTDTRLSILWYKDRVKGFVIETRSDSNKIQFVKGEVDL